MENFKITGKEKISFLPKTPGVYCFKNSAGSFLYIGKAANLRARVKNHFFQPSYRDNFFISQVAKIGYIKTKSEIEALILEANLIKRYEPKFNVIWRDDKQYFFVGFASPNPPGAEKAGFINLPVVFLTHQPNAAVKFKNTAQYIGPFTEGKPLKKILRFLRKIFPYYSQANHPKKLCPYCHLGLCPGPTPDEKKYRRNILKLKAILKGKQKKVLRDIKKEMKLAGEKEDFEKAGEIRDQIKSLENIFEHSKIIIPEKDHIWSEAEKNLKALLETNQKISRIEAYDISDIQGQEATASMITFINGIPDKNYYRQFRIKSIKKPNDIAMLKECLSRRMKHSEWPYADLILVDGGKAQLNAVIEIKNRKRETENILVVALAKKKNELFIEGKKKSVLANNLPRDLFNLTLKLRDEAHRFARKYHHKLRKKTFIY